MNVIPYGPFTDQSTDLLFSRTQSHPIGREKSLLIQGLMPQNILESIAKKWGAPWIPSPLMTFPCGEWGCSSLPNLIGIEVVLVHDLSPHHPDTVMALGLVCSAVAEARASKITLLSPYVPYGRNPKASRVLGGILRSFAIDLLITIDPHQPLLPQDTDLQTRALSGVAIFLPALDRTIDWVISPDEGGKHRAKAWAEHLGCAWTCLSKTRTEEGIEVCHPNPTLWKAKTCLIVDDLVDTGHTLAHTCAYVMAHHADSVRACITHGIFSNSCLERLHRSGLSALWISDTLPQGQGPKAPRGSVPLHVLPWTSVLSRL